MRFLGPIAEIADTIHSPVFRRFILATLLLASPLRSFSQEFTEAIEDNSFFIEEAYNQELGVVQHIFTGYYDRGTRDYIFSFTQEWPVGGQVHQLSYTIPYLSQHSGPRGIGDIALNYRYQLCDSGKWGWVSPRFTLLLPTGRPSEGLGTGVVGFQLNLPVSNRWSNGFVTHFNAGVTILSDEHASTSYAFGASGIWLLNENVNLMCEVLHTIDAEIDESGNVTHSSQTIISPGVRVAINLGALQIVPGLALPVTTAEGEFKLNAFGYLSFEHPL